MSGRENEVYEEARRWLRYAEEDAQAAQDMRRAGTGVPRHVCFLSQQAVEKALKAALVFLQIEFPYSHNLDALRNLLPDGWTAKRAHADLTKLSGWAVEARYPADMPEASEGDAEEAVVQAEAVLETMRADLVERGLTP